MTPLSDHTAVRGPFSACGPRSDRLLNALAGPFNPADDPLTDFVAGVSAALRNIDDIVVDDDLQLTLSLVFPARMCRN